MPVNHPQPFFCLHPTSNPSAGTARPSFKWRLLIQHLTTSSIITLVPAIIFCHLSSHNKLLMGLFNPILGSFTTVDPVQSKQNVSSWLNIRSHYFPVQSSPVSSPHTQDLSVWPSCSSLNSSYSGTLDVSQLQQACLLSGTSYFLQGFCLKSSQTKPNQTKQNKQILSTSLSLCLCLKDISSERQSFTISKIMLCLLAFFHFIVLFMNWHYIPGFF